MSSSEGLMSSLAEGVAQGPPPAYALFDANAVTLAAFLGGPVAGTSLMALNYRRLGQAGRAAITLLLGILATGLLLLLGWNLPNTVSTPIGVLFLFAVQRSARSLQGPAVRNHIERGGRLGSKWMAFGLGAVLLAALFAALFLASDNTSKVVIGSNDEVIYSGSATREEAQSLGNALRANGYFSDRGVSVFLTKERHSTIISFVIKKGLWDQPGVVSDFEEIGRQAAPSVGGLPVQIRLINAAREIKKESTVGRVVFAGNDAVYYVGAATESEAQALGQALKVEGFFEGKGSDVFVSRHGDSTTLSFVVSNGVWDNPAEVGDFEKIARHTAPAVVGLPVRLHLVNPLLEVKKDEWIK